MINAPVIAKERGIEVRETRDQGAGDYQTLIRVEVTTETQIRDVAGTLFADNRPRIVQVKGINLEAELAAHMLYITNEDKPGLIGSLGTLLGDSGINVATFHLGRSEPGGDAIALLGVDHPIDEAVLTLDTGDYGFCETCGVEIGVRRLEARPTATLCIDCKVLDEIRERQMG